MAKHREIFRAGAGKDGVDERKADEIFDLMEKFAGYGFNKSHAAAYSLVAYQTAWLKKHYPAEFMAATLSSDMDKTDKVVAFLDEARGLGLTVLPPDANHSDFMFVATDANTVRYGLGAVKGVGQGACEAIVKARHEGGAFSGLLDFCKRVDSSKLNKRALEALINAGALDALGKNRASLALQLPEVLKAIDQLSKNRNAGIIDMFGSSGGNDDIHIDLPQTDEWPVAQKLHGERETLGHYLSGHPIDPYREDLRSLVGHDLGELDKIWAAQPAGEKKGWRPEVTTLLAGQVVGVRRKGDSQMFVQLEDGRGRIECSVFSDSLAEFGPVLTRDRILIVKGGLREDEFSGGFSLRIRQCWDYAQLCAQHAQRLSLRLDLRVPGLWERVDALLARHRPGGTPLRLDLLMESGKTRTAGMLDLNGSKAVRVDTELLDALRAQPGVRAVKLSLARPWTN
jgi:DNA polymerase-3 subunit alpha